MFLLRDTAIKPGPTLSILLHRQYWKRPLQCTKPYATWSKNFLMPKWLAVKQSGLLLKEEELHDCVKMSKCYIVEGKFLMIFQNVPSSITEVLGVRRPRDLTMQTVQLDEGGNIMMKAVEASPNLTTVREIFRHRSVPFSGGTYSFHD